jgi:glucans biosynthesis protein
MLNGAGEWIWRPLINPERLQFSVFVDKNPKGFGLVQRDRSFADYQDLKQQFEKHPTLWIEPVGEWGEGSIDLIELPAVDESNENIVAFWRPKSGLGPGIGHHFNYWMHWCWEPPLKSNRLSVTQTRLGETKNGDPLFIVDFSSTDSCEACNSGPLAPTVTASAGQVRNVELVSSGQIGGHRLRFEFAPAGSDPIDIRAYLSSAGKPASESWIFRWAR